MSDLTSLYQKQLLRDIGIQASVNALLDLVNQYPDHFITGKFTDFFNTLGGTQPPKSHFIDHPKDGYIRFLQIRDFSSELTPTFIPVSNNNKICSENDILLGRYGASVGKILTGKNGAYNVACAKIESLSEINKKFLFYWLHNSKFQNQIRGITRSAQGGFNKNDLAAFDVVVLKYEYQDVVVEILEKIDKYLIDKKDIQLCLDSLHEFYQCFFKKAQGFLNSIHSIETLKNEAIFQQEKLVLLKQAILQEAIAGQLTAEWRTQNPMEKGNPDTDAAALLAKIKAEKQQLIADGKLKKETKQDSISESSLLIPDTWENPFLGDITKQITDGTHQTPNYVIKGKTFLSAQNVKPFRFIPENHRYITEQAFLDCIKNKVPEKGDLLIARVGAGIGETAVLDRDIEFAFYVSLGLVKVFRELTNSDYLAIVCNSPYGVQYAKGNISSSGTSAGNYNLGRIRSLKIPLPPLAEQKAIAEKVDRLMETIDQLEQQIKHRKQLAEDLMQTVLREAFE